MATKIPPHNLTEIVEATLKVLDTLTSKLELLKTVKGPDSRLAALSTAERNSKVLYTWARHYPDARPRRNRPHRRGATERDAIIITRFLFSNKAD